MIKRYLYQHIVDDLKNKMVFVGGPRQVGKTTISKNIGREFFDNPEYLNWDYRSDRKKILSQEFAGGTDLLIFDEIHKYRSWRNYLKGEFDKNRDKYSILVTGSARLDLYRHGGDSLLGRYHYIRLHPFSLAEISGRRFELPAMGEIDFDEKISAAHFKNLFRYGGFPEPFIKKDEIFSRRFRNERVDRLIREDVRDLENIKNLSGLQMLAEILPTKVMSLFSVNSIKEDLGVTHKTAAAWVDLLERFYYHFRIYPFASTKIKSLRKEPKLYLWDWSELEDEAARFENLIASHLLKLSHYYFDIFGQKVELNFLRDQGGREVDFLVTVNKKPWFMVEVKMHDRQISRNLEYFSEKIKAPFVYQVVFDEGVDIMKKNIRVISAGKFLSGLI